MHFPSHVKTWNVPLEELLPLRMAGSLLKKYHYPPEEAANALETVIRQCEQWTDNEMPVNEPKVYHLYESDYPMAAAERVEYNKK